MTKCIDKQEFMQGFADGFYWSRKQPEINVSPAIPCVSTYLVTIKDSGNEMELELMSVMQYVPELKVE